jgi:hypothetical protein
LLQEHGAKLDHDITVLSRTLRLVGTHIDQVDKLLQAGPVFVAGKNLDGKSGIAASYDKNLHAIDLRALVTPNVAQVFQALGLPTTLVCVPVTVQCQIPGTPLAVPPDLPSIQPLPSNAKQHKSKVGGLIRSISSVFG